MLDLSALVLDGGSLFPTLYMLWLPIRYHCAAPFFFCERVKDWGYTVILTVCLFFSPLVWVSTALLLGSAWRERFLWQKVAGVRGRLGRHPL